MYVLASRLALARIRAAQRCDTYMPSATNIQANVSYRERNLLVPSNHDLEKAEDAYLMYGRELLAVER
jgi:hypothetical protein